MDISIEPLLEDLTDRTPYRRHELRTALTRFAQWAEGPAALEVADLGELLTVRNIERFIHSGLDDYASASRANIRSRLLRISELVLDPQGRRVRLSAIGPADALRPYTRPEVAALYSWAATQSTPRRRRNATVLLALGVGAGLSATEIANARRCDVEEHGDRIDIVVRSGRTRTVPMVAQWADALRPLLSEQQDPDRYLFRSDRQGSWPNVISNFVQWSGAHDVHPQSQRMRATWIVRHLSAGTNVRVLVRAAGVDSLEAFTRYLSYVDEPDADRARAELVRAAN